MYVHNAYICERDDTSFYVSCITFITEAILLKP